MTEQDTPAMKLAKRAAQDTHTLFGVLGDLVEELRREARTARAEALADEQNGASPRDQPHRG